MTLKKNYLLEGKYRKDVVAFSIKRENMPTIAGWYQLAPNAKKMVGIAHGIMGHGNRHMDQITFYLDLGYSVFWFDFRGHGHSEGPRASIENVAEYIDDLAAVVQFIRIEVWQDKPLILSGHSLGGIVITHYLGDPIYGSSEQNIAAFIADTPTYGPSPKVSKTILIGFNYFASFLVRLGFGKTKVTGFAASDLARDPGICRSHSEDELCSKKISIQTGIEILKGMSESRDLMCYISIPSLYLAGTDDRIAGYKFMVDNVAAIPEPYKRNSFWKLFPDAGHELFFDVGYSPHSKENKAGYNSDTPDSLNNLNAYYQTLRAWLQYLDATQESHQSKENLAAEFRSILASL